MTIDVQTDCPRARYRYNIEKKGSFSDIARVSPEYGMKPFWYDGQVGGALAYDSYK